ncbi:hypothetical protein HDV04_004112 [Boothiomyces sp. JEL0838]|nr:hypothetical protein HDV04_004112 [Boothiomyces sp. JEL0838]
MTEEGVQVMAQDQPQDLELESTEHKASYVELFQAYLPLAFISFGGPQAHIALFHNEFVEKRKWIPDNIFVELFAIAQSLPGPASTQLGYSIALLRGGFLYAFVEFLIWSVPGTLILIGIAAGVSSFNNSLPTWLSYAVNGMSAAAVGLVAIAAYKLCTKVIKDNTSIILCAVSAALAISVTGFAWLYLAIIIGGGLITFIEGKALAARKGAIQLESGNNSRRESVAQNTRESLVQALSQEELEAPASAQFGFKLSLRYAFVILGIWLVLLIGAVIIRAVNSPRALDIVGSMYFVGSIIFGGGPVVIPMLQSYVVDQNWMTNREFLIGLAFINSMPGPNFNLAAYCGALALRGSPLMIIGGFLGTLGIFSPGLLLMSGLIPLWNKYRKLESVQLIFKGMNASAVGLVFAAVYILAMKCIVIAQGVNSGNVDSLTNHPVYTSIALLTFSFSGFLNLHAPIAILLGCVTGLIDYAIHM